MKTICLFDLELTLIDEWDSFILINQDKIQSIISTLSPDTIFGLFSFAVWDQKDLNKLNTIRSDIEQHFGFKFDDNFMWTIQDIIKLVEQSITGLKMNQMDFFDFFGKETSLFNISKLKEFQNTHLILVDDTVDNNKVFNQCRNNQITFIKV